MPRDSAAVAVINYNGRRYLPELLDSLAAQDRQPSEWIFVDNDSSDGSVEYLEQRHPRARLMPQRRNLGFARAANLAVESANARFVALLNADLKLDPAWLGEMVRTAERTGAAAVASKILLYDRPRTLNGVGGCMNFLGYTWDRGMWESDDGQYDEAAEVLFASAGAAVFDRGSFLSAGSFDARFFMYHEDVDLCWRLWLFGERVVTCPGAVAYHHFGGATKAARGMEWRELLGERNNIRTLIKNYELPNLRRSLAGLLALRQPSRRKLLQLRNFAWNLFFLPETLALRRKIQRRRKRADREISRLIVESKDVPIRL